jgi:hypothetical protein
MRHVRKPTALQNCNVRLPFSVGTLAGSDTGIGYYTGFPLDRHPFDLTFPLQRFINDIVWYTVVCSFK